MIVHVALYVSVAGLWQAVVWRLSSAPRRSL